MPSVLIRFPGGLEKAVTLSYDDGVVEDIRLIEIMKKNGLRGTFNLNAGLYIAEDFVYPPETRSWGRRLTRAQAIKLYRQDGIEPALHGYTHPRLESLPSAQMTNEVLSDRKEAEAMFEAPVRGMAYPYGTYNDTVLRVLADCGVTYCRTVAATNSFALPKNWLEWNPTCHHNSPELENLTEKFLNEKPRGDYHDGWVFYLWGHSYEFGKDDNWARIENFAEKVGNRDDIWYATNMEIYEYIEAFRRLVFTLDQKTVYNPSSIPVWFRQKNVNYCVNPGEMLAFEAE